MASEWKNGMLDELHKLSAIESEETLNDMVCTLCSTRKTGLPLSDKSHFQSLLQLSSLSQLDTVLACLRYLLRKCAHHNLSRHDILKLFPPHLPLHLQTNLLSSLHKNKDRWKEYVSVSPPQLAARDGASSLLWPPREQQQQQEALHQFNRADLEPAPTEVAPCFRCDAVAASENLESLPCLKSITWTMENRGSSPADREAIISLKLHDYSKSPSGETEVKFQLTRDTLEAMLRSMTYISEQLSAVGTSSEPANKKRKQ